MKKRIISFLLSAAAAVSMCGNVTSMASFESAQTVSTSKSSIEFITDSKSGYTYYINDDNTAVLYKFADKSVTSVTVPSKIGGHTVSKIGDYCFQDFTKLSSVTMPDTVLELGIAAFRNCTSLRTVKFSKNLEHLSVYVFENCYSLKKLDLPDTVETVYSGVFDGCTNLEEIHIPASLNYFSSLVGKNVFDSCPKLTTMTFGTGIKIEGSYPKGDDYSMVNYLYIPSTVTDISVIGESFNFKHDEWRTFAIGGKKGSAAEKFANTYGILFLDVEQAEASLYNYGDVDNSGRIDAVDASKILAAYAALATGKTPELDAIALIAADANEDGKVDASDASSVLSYYAYTSTTSGDVMSFGKFIGK